MSEKPPYGPPISLELAKKAALACEAESAKLGVEMAIAVVDSGGTLVLLHKMDHTQIGSVDVAISKARTANHFKRSTRLIDQAVQEGGAGLRMLSIPGVTAIEGGELLMQNGRIIGGIGVSGSLSANDLQVALAGVRAIG